MRIIKIFALMILLTVIGLPLVIFVGSYLALDHDLMHTQATQALPTFPDGVSTEVSLTTIEAGGYRFRARIAGFGQTQGNVILLHGFPETSAMYNDMLPSLAAAGFQVVAFDQRGYSPGARPEDMDAYTADKLVADVYAVAAAVGFEEFHLVGHDWGAVVGWVLVFDDTSKVKSWSALRRHGKGRPPGMRRRLADVAGAASRAAGGQALVRVSSNQMPS